MIQLRREDSQVATFPAATVALTLLSLLAITAGSQWGMLILSYLYATQGRTPLQVTPELVLGLLAATAAAVATLTARIRLVSSRSFWLLLSPFLVFVGLATISELFQRDIYWRNLTVFISLAAYLVIGAISGYVLCSRHIKLAVNVVLCVFVGWYVGLILLGLGGHLTLENILIGTEITRLEVAGGFTATEIPIYIGMQLPILLMVILGPFGRIAKLLSYALLVGVVTVLYLTASTGAIVASSLVVATFVLYGSGQTRLRALALTASIALMAIGFGTYYFSELYTSITEKFAELASGGGRSRTIALLVSLAQDHPWFGIGKSRFQELNNFGWFGDGIYPHHNILGIAAELGIMASIFYCLAMIAFIWHFASRLSKLQRHKMHNSALILVAALSVLIYQQARGMLHDTWVIKELYFWVGFGIGAAYLLSHYRAGIFPRLTHTVPAQTRYSSSYNYPPKSEPQAS